MTPRSGEIALLVAGMAPLAIVAGLALARLPPFERMYAGFNADMPLASRLLFVTYRWYGLLCGVLFALWLLWPNRTQRGAAAFVIGAVGSGVLLVFSLWAAYLPLLLHAAIGSAADG